MQTNHHPLIQESLSLEQKFFANQYQGHDQNSEVAVITGASPILIAAPHAVKHPRKGSLKKADAMTGTIATQLAMRTHAHALVLAKTGQEDPNYDPGGPYKQLLARQITNHEINLVINLHGMTENHQCDIVIGTGLGQTINQQNNVLTTMKNIFISHSITNIQIDNPDLFPAKHPNNLSQYSWRELQTPSLQLEISYFYRNPAERPESYHQLLEALTDIIDYSSSAIRPSSTAPSA